MAIDGKKNTFTFLHADINEEREREKEKHLLYYTCVV